MYRPLLQQGIWRIRTNQEWVELHKVVHKVADIKRERLEWTGPLFRMDQRTTVKKIFESKPEGSRRSGRPRLRWLEEVEKGVREVKGSGNRRQSLGKNWRP
jgi:hypothetical protein